MAFPHRGVLLPKLQDRLHQLWRPRGLPHPARPARPARALLQGRQVSGVKPLPPAVQRGPTHPKCAANQFRIPALPPKAQGAKTSPALGGQLHRPVASCAQEATGPPKHLHPGTSSLLAPGTLLPTQGDVSYLSEPIQCERCETHEGKDVVTGRQMELQKILDPDSAWFGRWLCWICIGRVYPQFLFSPRTRRGARRAPAQAGGRIS